MPILPLQPPRRVGQAAHAGHAGHGPAGSRILGRPGARPSPHGDQRGGTPEPAAAAPEAVPPPWATPAPAGRGESVSRTDISDCARERILILDGAWGTMLQRAGLTEDDFRFDGAEADRSYQGNFDPVSYTHLRAHETRHDLVCRLLL